MLLQNFQERGKQAFRKQEFIRRYLGNECAPNLARDSYDFRTAVAILERLLAQYQARLAQAKAPPPPAI